MNETLRVGIQRKATEQYFPVVLFIILHKFVLTFKTVIETPSAGIQMKATEDYFPLVSVTCAVKNCGTVYYGVQGGSYSHSNESYTEQYFPVVLHVYHPVQGGSPLTKTLTACLHGGGGPQVGEITCFGGVTRQSR